MKPKIYLPILSLSFILLSRAGTFAQVTLDSSFGGSGIVITSTTTTSEINSSVIQPDGKIVAAGYLITGTDYHFMVARYNANGTQDNSFGAGGIVNTYVNNSDMPYSMLLQPDGKIVVAGNYYDGTSSTSGNYHCAIVRYNSDGTPDNSFGPAGIVTTVIDSSEDDMISSIALQTDGKIVAGGFAGSRFLLMRYNDSGALDSSFGSAGKVLTTIELESSIYSIAIQNDGKIVATGTTGNTSNFKFALARYNTDGTPDSSFGSGGTVTTDIASVFYDFAASMTILPGGKILTGGYSDGNIALAKYNNDGTLDTGFGTGGKVTTNNYPPVPMNSLAVQPDGKIIVSGTVNNGGYDFSLTRFNADGTPDSSFGVNGNISADLGSTTDYAHCLSLQPDGKIVVCGSSRDSSAFSPARFTLARFTSDLNTGITNISTPYTFNTYPNPAKDNIRVEISKELILRAIKLYDMNGKLIKTFSPSAKLLNIEGISQGPYLLKIISDKETCTKKILKQ